jgi:hypothetical protein
LKRSIMSGSAAALAIALSNLSTMGLGVPAGTTMPCQKVTTKSFIPVASAIVAISGKAAERAALVIAMARVLPVARIGFA